jgi:hypothetical protein
MIGGSKARRSKEAWTQVYRTLEHSYARSQCKDGNTISKFPKSIQNFATLFVQMQSKRHDADYHPDAKFYKSSVQSDLSSTKKVIDDFSKAPQLDRRAFAAWVLLKTRKY